MSYIYLASPYTHADTALMQDRFTQTCEAVAKLVLRGDHVFSPIVHMHPVAELFELPRDAGFWHHYNQAMIRGASRLLVLQLEGWKVSGGVHKEVQWAKGLDIPISYLGLSQI